MLLGEVTSGHRKRVFHHGWARLGDFERCGWIGAVKDGGLDDFELLAGQGDFALDGVGLLTALEPFAQCLGNHFLGGFAVFTSGVEQFVQLVDGKLDDRLAENFIGGPLWNVRRGPFPFGDGRVRDFAAKIISGDFAQSKAVVDAPLIKLCAGHGNIKAYFGNFGNICLAFGIFSSKMGIN